MISFFLQLLRDLIHGDSQARTNAAVLLVTCGVLSLATILITLAIIFSTKNLIAEFGTVVGALTGLSGHAYYTAKKFGQDSSSAVNGGGGGNGTGTGSTT